GVTAEQADQAFGQFDLAFVDEKVTGVSECGRLVGHGLDQCRVAVAESGDGDSGDEVQILAAVGVVDLAAASECQGGSALSVIRHERSGAAVMQIAGGHCVSPLPWSILVAAELRSRDSWPFPASRAASSASSTTMVPIPRSVKTCRRRECGTRPSMMCAWGTPPSTACRHASSLGDMPEESLGSRARSSSVLRRLMSSVLSG